MTATFSQASLEKTFQKVCSGYNLTPEHIMSTSGAYFVWLCLDKNKKPYLVKIRRGKNRAKKNEFYKEIYCNEFLGFSKKIYSDLSQAPEYLVYKLINGQSLSQYYFFIDRPKFKQAYDVQKKIQWLQKQTPQFLKICQTKNINLPVKKFNDNWVVFKKYKKNLTSVFSAKTIASIEQVLVENKKLFNQSLKLAHSDLHPKNIIITPQNKIAFIDWSDIGLNNVYFDLAFLWLTLWNLPAQQQQLINNIKNKQLFFLNILLLLPKYLQLLQDAAKATHQEYKQGIINRQQQQNLLKLNQQATKFYKINIFNFFKHV